MKSFVDYILIWKFVILARVLKFAAKLLKKGSGTSLPGLLIEKYYPQLIRPLASQYKNIILITGTNGKTTTRSILNHLFRKGGQSVCTNSGGANIYRGLASSLLFDFNVLQNRPTSQNLILEVEEATLPRLSKYLAADYLILTNVFRDQLDAYAEIDKTVQYFEQSIDNLTQNNQTRTLNLIYNQEDPLLNQLISRIKKQNLELLGFGLEIDESQKPKYEGEMELQKSPVTNQSIIAKNVVSTNLSSSFDCVYNSQNYAVQLPLNGIYNIYNALPALAIGLNNFPSQQVISSLSTLKTVFGRGETLKLGSNSIQLFLVKNPAGFDQVLQSLITNPPTNPENAHFVTLINDNIADGRDVSWLWDIDFEKYKDKLQEHFNDFSTGGIRGFDMLLRLEIGGWNVNPTNNFRDFSELATKIEASHNQTFCICATYTAMMDLRKLLSKKVALASINSQEF